MTMMMIIMIRMPVKTAAQVAEALVKIAVKIAAQVVEELPTATDQKDQTMAGSSTDTLQLEHRLGTTVIRATLELGWSHVLVHQTENGNQSCQLVNVRISNK